MNQKIALRISGMHCQSCVINIESVLKREKGVVEAVVNLATEEARLSIDPSQISLEKVKEIIKKAGYVATEEAEGMHDHHQMAKEQEIKKLKKRFILTLVFGLPVLYLTMGAMLGLPDLPVSEITNITIQFVLTSLVIVSSFNIWTSGVKGLFRLKPNMDSLIFLGTSVAFFYSLILGILLFFGRDQNSPIYFESAALILVFISLGKYLEGITKGKTSQAVKKLIGLVPKETIVIKNGQEIKIPITQVQIDDIILVKPGEKVPVDGVVVEGNSFVDEAMITGEPIPKSKAIGSEVIGGTINKNSVLKFKATRVGSNTMLSQIIKMVEAAMGSKAPIQALADKVSYYFVPTVFAIAVLSLAVWLLLGQPLSFGLKVFVAVLVIACPCVLGLATPTVIMMATGMGASKGILIKSGRALEVAQKVDTVVFDKTGTLTIGKPQVVDIAFLGHFTEKDILGIAASLEKNSQHPLALAIVKKAAEAKVPLSTISDFETIEGKGLSGKIKTDKKQANILLGNKRLMLENNIVVGQNEVEGIEHLENQGKTVVLLGVDQKLAGIIAISDTLKENSKEAVALLQKDGKKVAMITGDNHRAANAIAKDLGIDMVIAEVLPQDKANEVKKLQATGKVVSMVGDGINDAPALAQADLGVALGSGTDIAMETGDIILMKDNLLDVVLAISLSRYTFSKIKQNLFWAFGYNVLGIPIAAGVLFPFTGFLLNPAIAALAMAFSSVSVVSNSLLMKRKKL